MNGIQVLPLPKVAPFWDHKDSRYPERIKVSMSDGRVVSYRIDVEQPHPCFLTAMENLQHIKSIAHMDGCWNCLQYTGDYCTIFWKHMDESYKIEDRDAKEPDYWCPHWQKDPDAVWEDCHGTDT